MEKYSINEFWKKATIYLGKDGLDKSWQKEFEPTTKCHKCGSESRVAFVNYENQETKSKICELHKNKGKGEYWPHDMTSTAVYICKNCMEPTAIMNQG